MVISALIVGTVLFCVTGFVVLFLSLAAVYAIAPHVGSYVVAFVVVAMVHLVIALIAFSMRRRLIMDPIANFLASLFLEDKEESKDDGVSTASRDDFSFNEYNRR